MQPIVQQFSPVNAQLDGKNYYAWPTRRCQGTGDNLAVKAESLAPNDAGDARSCLRMELGTDYLRDIKRVPKVRAKGVLRSIPSDCPSPGALIWHKGNILGD
jgi:hypothetical protein